MKWPCPQWTKYFINVTSSFRDQNNPNWKIRPGTIDRLLSLETSRRGKWSARKCSFLQRSDSRTESRAHSLPTTRLQREPDAMGRFVDLGNRRRGQRVDTVLLYLTDHVQLLWGELVATEAWPLFIATLRISWIRLCKSFQKTLSWYEYIYRDFSLCLRDIFLLLKRCLLVTEFLRPNNLWLKLWDKNPNLLFNPEVWK